MDIKKLKEFIQLAKSENVTELKYENKDTKYSVSFKSEPVQQLVTAAPAQSVSLGAPQKKSSVVEENFHVITSPFVGTFYSSPSPEKPLFTKVGARISKGETLCILEAMKIMNEIESDISGEVIEVCVENESLVEFGQALFKIRV